MNRLRAAGIAGIILGSVALAVWAWRAVPAPMRVPTPAAGGRQRPQGDLYVGAFAEPADLNPFTTQGTVARRYVLRYTHDALMDLDPVSGALRPALARDVTTSPDGLEHDFTLREDLRFADGSPVEIDDVLFTWRAAQAPDLPLGAFAQVAARIESVEALGEDRLRIRLREPGPRVFGIVATEFFVVQAEHYRARIRELAGTGAVPKVGAPGFGRLLAQVEDPGPGTGAFWLPPDGWRRRTDLTLVQNPLSWRRVAYPDSWNLAGLKLRFLADDLARVAALRQQEIDWIADPGPKSLLDDPEVARNYRRLVYDHVQLGHYLVLWNHRRPGLDDRRVRMALTLCFDRERIIRDLMGGDAQPASSWFKPGDSAVPPGVEPLPFDPARARALLAEAGFDPAVGRPLRLSLCFAATETLHREIVELARPAFARAGIELNLEGVPFATMVAKLNERDFDGMLAVIGLERWNDPYGVFHSSQSASGRNWMGYADVEVDALLERGRAAVDEAARIAAYHDLGRLFQRDQPVTLLVHPLSAVLLHRRFEGVEPGALGLVPERWWVAPEHRRY